MTVEGFRFFALKRMRVGDEWREPGDEVPEAAEWRNLPAYINQGHLTQVPIHAVKEVPVRAQF